MTPQEERAYQEYLKRLKDAPQSNRYSRLERWATPPVRPVPAPQINDYGGYEGAVSMMGVPLWGVPPYQPPVAPSAIISSPRYPIPPRPAGGGGTPAPQTPAQPAAPQYAPDRGGYIQDAGQPASRLTLRYTPEGQPVITGRDAAQVPNANMAPAGSALFTQGGGTQDVYPGGPDIGAAPTGGMPGAQGGEPSTAQPGMMPWMPPAGSPEFYYQVALKQGASPENAMRFAQSKSGGYKAPAAPANDTALAYAAAQGDPRAKAALEALKEQKKVSAAPVKEMGGGMYQWNPETQRYDIYAGSSKERPEAGRDNVVLSTPEGYVVVNKLTGEKLHTGLNKPLSGNMIDTEQQLGTLKGTFDKVKSLYSPEYTGPIQGRTGRLASVTTGNAPDRATFLSAMQDINNAIVYLKSGKQINEQEYSRLRNAMPNVDLADSDFKARMAEFDRVLRSIEAERTKAKKGWGETTGTSQPNSGSHPYPDYPDARQAPDGKWYVQRNGQFMEVAQ